VIGFQPRECDGAQGHVIFRSHGNVRAEVGEVEGCGEGAGCRVHRADRRHRGIRVGEGARLIHVDFEPIQIGNRVHGSRIDIGSRRFPTQRLRGKRGSGFRGRASSTASDQGCCHDPKCDNQNRPDSSRQMQPSLKPEGSQ
ncbi:MAG: hypothetical protein H6Q22_1367, partial [Bacteroidetes bacterium]|nr:hypothetical protein [Bacteroidota bacterium]